MEVYLDGILCKDPQWDGGRFDFHVAVQSVRFPGAKIEADTHIFYYPFDRYGNGREGGMVAAPVHTINETWLLQQKASRTELAPERAAFVTLLYSDSYLPGVLALAESIKEVKSRHGLVVIVPEKALKEESLAMIRAVGATLEICGAHSDMAAGSAFPELGNGTACGHSICIYYFSVLC